MDEVELLRLFRDDIPGPTTDAWARARTAVNGCPGLAATSGVLERVTGTSLVLKTPSGAPVTVTTTASAKVSRQVTGTVSGIRDGMHVIVQGAGSAGGSPHRSS
jgi:hypothetical protein